MKRKKRLFLLILSLFLVACASNNDTNDNEEIPVEDRIHTVGDKVEVNNIEIQLNDASFTSTEGKKDPTNDKVLTFDVTVTNKERAKDFLVDHLHFKLTDADGEEMDIYYGYEESGINGLLSTGISLDGKLFFDVTDSDSYELTYKPATEEKRVTLTFEIDM